MIDLCVVNYNTKAMLHRLVDILMNDIPRTDYRGEMRPDNKARPWRLFIADNGSTDGSFQSMREPKRWKDAPFVIFEWDNIGYAAACNKLAKFSSNYSATGGDIIGLLNADVWLKTSDVMSIQRTFDENPEVAILGPKQRDEQGHITHAGIEGTNAAPKHRSWHVYDPDDVLHRDFKEMVTVSGSAYFVRRSVWEALTNDPEYKEVSDGAEGAFLPTPHYYEETFCSYFARHRGYKVFYDGRISIGHSWHASHPKGSPQDKMFTVSRGIFRDACDRIGIEHD